MASSSGRRPRNAWVDDEEIDRAADTARRLATPGAFTQHPEPDGGSVAAAAGLANPGDPPRPVALVSTAAGYTIGEPPVGRLTRPKSDEGWSAEVWAMFDAVGELHYVATQYARAVARGRLYVARYNEDGYPEEVDGGEAGRINREMLGGPAKASDVLYLSSVQQFMSGQSLITVTDVKGGGQEWEAYSDQDFTVDRSALRSASTRKGARSLYRVDTGGGTAEPLPAGTLTIHMWDRHPGRAHSVESSVRPALPYLRELARLDQYVQSLLLSRIALSGILQVPPDAQVVVPPELQDLQGLAQGGHGLMHTLAAIGMSNITNPGTAAAVLPVLFQLSHPDQKLDLLTLEQPLAGEINAFREINLKRLAMSLDLAPEAMSGFSNVKYSNAEWILTESVQTHIIRRLKAFASALTTAYVVPALGDEYIVDVDTSDLESDEDRTAAALDLYDRGEIDGDTLRRKARMKDAKPPTPEELLRQLAIRAVTTNPSLFPALAPLLGLRESITVEQARLLEEAGPGDSGLKPQPIPDPAPAAPTSPDPGGPETVRGPQPIVSDALIAACDVVVSSALASAGSRWRKRVRARATLCRGTEPHAVYLLHPLCADRDPGEDPAEYAAQLVADRWPQVPRIAALHAADPGCLQSTLSTYVAGLIAAQRPHHPTALADVLADCVPCRDCSGASA